MDKKIAEPNNLYFDEFNYDDGQLSFRVSRFDAPKVKGHKNEKRVDSASGVAQAVCKACSIFLPLSFLDKRRKDIQTLAGVEVDETGIGSGIVSLFFVLSIKCSCEFGFSSEISFLPPFHV